MLGFRWMRRRRLAKQPFPREWARTLRARLLRCFVLSPEQQRKLQYLIKVFVAEKNFEGCAGLAVTDEMKVTVAAYACLLLLNRKTDIYPRLQSILLYPNAYLAPAHTYLMPGLYIESSDARLGEAWQAGLVVLSWSEILQGISQPDAGRNVIIHEFAHQLDMEDFQANSVPVLPKHNMYPAWRKVFAHEYLRLRREQEEGGSGMLDPYGATNPAEFFAVVTEAFLLRPNDLQARHPDLYQQLALFYGQPCRVRAADDAEEM